MNIVDSKLLELPMATELEESMMSYNGIDPAYLDKDDAIDNVKELQLILNKIFTLDLTWPQRKSSIESILHRVDLTNNEVNKFIFWDAEKAYTRNLIASDNKNYTLLLLCWNPGKESKIHNHPCDGCFIKTLRGCIKETRYNYDGKKEKLLQTKVRFFNEGQTSYMDDYIGFHKVTNPYHDTGAVTMHLYTPPFSECKVFLNESDAQEIETGIVGFYSSYGHRTPMLEGKPGSKARLMKEISDLHCTKPSRLRGG